MYGGRKHHLLLASSMIREAVSLDQLLDVFFIGHENGQHNLHPWCPSSLHGKVAEPQSWFAYLWFAFLLAVLRNMGCKKAPGDFEPFLVKE